MLSILERYKWHQFSVVTSQIAGHDDFVQAVRYLFLISETIFFSNFYILDYFRFVNMSTKCRIVSNSRF
jgi:hypothetical protein